MNNTPTTHQTKWYNKPPFSLPAFIFFATIVFFPLGIFLLWKSNVKKGWKVVFTIIGAFFGLIVTVAIFAPKTPEMIEERQEDSLAQVNKAKIKTGTNTSTNKQIPSYFNADTLQAYYSAPPLNYYFIRNDAIGRYSTYNGYVSKEIAESPTEFGKHKDQEIEIQFNPETKEIYRAYLKIHNLHSLYPKPNDLRYALQFVSAVSPAAAAQFERNFSKIFSDYLNDKPIDSNKYFDNDKKLTIEIDYDLDVVAKKEEKISDAYIMFGILNDGNEYTPDEGKISAAKKEKEEILKKAFSSYNGSHIKLTEYIKAHMNDPESFEHVETTYIEPSLNDDYVQVKETFRGKNAYNATVLNTVWAKCKIDGGDVIEIEKQN